MSATPMRGFFITGTDTGIGKTCVTAGLTWAFQQSGWRVAPIKPLAAGQQPDARGLWLNDDVARLHAVQRLGLSLQEVGPLQLREPCAPHIAARLEGRRIDRDALLRSVRATAAKAELALIEGVGGFRVPLTDEWDSADLATDLGLPVVLVVGLRLGCINHALLSVEAVRARGLRLAGWVANTVEPRQPHVAENLATLRSRIGAATEATFWGHLPRLPEPSPAAVAAHLSLPLLPARLDSSDASPPHSTTCRG